MKKTLKPPNYIDHGVHFEWLNKHFSHLDWKDAQNVKLYWQIRRWGNLDGDWTGLTQNEQYSKKQEFVKEPEWKKENSRLYFGDKIETECIHCKERTTATYVAGSGWYKCSKCSKEFLVLPEKKEKEK